ncbi:MAG: type III secretion system export apparatus subunit SctV [Deltaproteobacteria bacterium]|nr:type III secretion system export apparatus subunit SctV [Deltaproteobacteria bacterium]
MRAVKTQIKSSPKSLKGVADGALAALVIAIVATMIVPIPLVVLDLLLALNLSLSIVLLLVALFVADALAIASFPTILLVTTLYRLALDVAATRNILGRADGGEMIRAFGQFVVRGNYVVGAVVFAILTLVQFLVIAKGSERVAEVGARFTLDAMPGKQMAIDAELRAGAIDQAEARRRRRFLARESSFFGAMDGAMKFVKGDAIAGIVITLINLLGGLAIGVGQRSMSANDALRLYGLMTIGEGLVAQIPALIVSTAAGLLVTRVASENPDDSLGGEIARQVLGQPRALAIAAGVVALFGLSPGMPTVPFFVIALALGVGARLVQRSQRRDAQRSEVVGPATTTNASLSSGERALPKPLLTPVEIEVGISHVSLVESSGARDAPLRSMIPLLREWLFGTLGISLPSVRVRVNAEMDARMILVRIHEIPELSLTVEPGSVHVSAHPMALQERSLACTPYTLSFTQRPGAWVSQEVAELLAAEGIEQRSIDEVVTLELRAALRRCAPSFLGIQETQALLDGLESSHPALIRNLVPKPIAVPLLAEVLRRLVEERVSVRPLREILEGLAPYANLEKDPVVLADLARVALRRQLSHELAPNGRVAVWFLSPDLSEAIRDSIARTATGAYLRLDPGLAREITVSAREQLPSGSVLICDPDIRRFVWVLLESSVSNLRVIAHSELQAGVSLEPLGTLGP